MSNRNYIKGRAYEYKAKKVLEEQGYTVVRTAGSHGPWDLMAIKEGTDEPVKCVQIKVTKSEDQLKRLLRGFKPQTNGTATRSYVHELWVYYKAKWHKS